MIHAWTRLYLPEIPGIMSLIFTAVASVKTSWSLLAKMISTYEEWCNRRVNFPQLWHFELNRLDRITDKPDSIQRHFLFKTNKDWKWQLSTMRGTHNLFGKWLGGLSQCRSTMKAATRFISTEIPGNLRILSSNRKLLHCSGWQQQDLRRFLEEVRQISPSLQK